MRREAITIIKNNHLGKEVWRYPGEIVAQTAKGILLEAYFNRADLLFNGIVIKEHDRFLEYYSRDKWYNIYEIYDPDGGSLKAWYCNVTRPPCWSDGFLSYDDLALDLLVYPSGEQITLDADEFECLGLPEADKIRARGALEELRGFFSPDTPFNILSLM